jgi:SsrA-binding protein
MAQKVDKIIVTNRKARHDYEILSSLEVGIVLQGTEVKSIRDGKVNITDTYARFRKGELWLIGLRISEYKNSTHSNHDPLRDRKLLLHKTELKKLFRKVEEKGLTLIPLKIYLNRHLVKIELGVVRGKKQYDKRAAIAERESKRELDRQKKIKF